MSTRCNILVTKTNAYSDSASGCPNPNNGLKTTQLYHHHDGYPTGVGLELAQAILALNAGPEELATDHDVRYRFIDKLPRQYEIESGTYFDQVAHLHGDIEWVYHLDFDNGITLTAYKRPGFDTEVPDDDSWRKWPSTRILRLEAVDYGPRRAYSLRALEVKA